MRPRIVVVGAGGHAKVILDLLEQQGELDIVGCTDPSTAGGDVLGYPILGSDAILPDLFASGVHHGFIAIGDNNVRSKTFGLLRGIGIILINVISSRAVISRHASLGAGIAVMGGAVINTGSVVGDGAIINTGAIVDHDCHVSEYAHICPGAALAGCVQIGQGALVGTGASIKPGMSVGAWTTVGAGAVVVRDLPARVTAIGVPAVIVDRKTN